MAIATYTDSALYCYTKVSVAWKGNFYQSLGIERLVRRIAKPTSEAIQLPIDKGVSRKHQMTLSPFPKKRETTSVGTSSLMGWQEGYKPEGSLSFGSKKRLEVIEEHLPIK